MSGADEGYMALYISIVANKTVDDAFERLNGNFIRHQRVWTEQDFQLIETMRKRGEAWQDIADAIGSERATCRRAWERWRERNERKLLGRTDRQERRDNQRPKRQAE